ncbi:MAG: SDR family oxidoreductase, partial [Gemmatimonadota bacterium]|nr:SDR family oxidoreductase [Gemmatimonadota bacterium]
MSRRGTERRGALVTGASAGIGRELAQRLAAAGWPVALTARRRERLEGLAADIETRHGVRALPVAADLEDPEGPARIEAALAAEGFEVDFLVNNAGFGTWGPFAERPLAAQTGMIRVNVLAPTELTRRLLPAMRDRGAGRILNVASTAAFQPGPWMAVYFASKAYVLHFSEALREELRRTGVTVTVLCPGPTRTEFQERADMERTRVGRNPFLMD